MGDAEQLQAITIGVAATVVQNGVAVRTDAVSMRVLGDYITRVAGIDRSIDEFTQALADGLSFGAHLSHQPHFAGLVAGFVGKTPEFSQIRDAGLDGAWVQIHHDGKGRGRASVVGAAPATTIESQIAALRAETLDPASYAVLVGANFEDIR